MTEAKTHPATELGALVQLQVEMLQREGATILGCDDDAGTVLASIPDVATVRYTLKIVGRLPPLRRPG